ncbi:MAG: glycerol-3-phosphate acyltransferase, partial [Anaerococcus vaginalis]|nr:glycerol-3-phosphate acyltransferase [Anaerococcus vaginalis]
MKFVLVALFSYLIGSIPFSYIIAKVFFKKDIRIM